MKALFLVAAIVDVFMSAVSFAHHDNGYGFFFAACALILSYQASKS